jgi:two-component sensor histidine kinase
LPTWHGAGFVAADQVRPTTGPTTMFDDIVGHYAARGRRPLLDRAFASRAVTPVRTGGTPAAVEAVPVIRHGRFLGIVERHSTLRGRTYGPLEGAYLEAADELALMMVEGSFPPAASLARTGSPPRVGDGFVRLDERGVVRFASPNARSAYHRLGLATDLVGMDLARTTARLARRPGPVDEALAAVAAGRASGGAEIENAGAVVTLRGVPLERRGRHTGAVVLVRDATEIRRRDRALVSKDATIREIHHRVKNNLQTVAALLRLQARRIEAPEAREALEEAVRRVGAIALVHETLSHSPEEQVDADEVAERLVTLLRDMASTGPVPIVREGSFGELPAEIVTPLAMALGELLQNAVEHGQGGEVHLRADRDEGRLVIEVTDQGPGIPDDVDPFDAGRLGLQIVRTLVSEELGGTLVLESGEAGTGTRARVEVPLPDPSAARSR